MSRFVLLLAVLGEGLSTVMVSGPAHAEVGVYGPPAPPVPASKPIHNAAAVGTCASERREAPVQDIIVCARTGFRLDPDVLAAQKAMRRGSRPTNPHESFKDHSCATIGPMGCRGLPTVDLVRMATVLGTMAAKASHGENVGAMFVTDPQPTEYSLYKEAKAKREAAEVEAAAKAPAIAPKAEPGGPTVAVETPASTRGHSQ